MKNHGPAIYFDNSSKGKKGNHNCLRADITIRGIRYRKRSKDRHFLERWLRGMNGGKS
jgi:hypothetical protein